MDYEFHYTHIHRWTYRHAFIGFHTKLPVISIVKTKRFLHLESKMIQGCTRWSWVILSFYDRDSEAGDCNLLWDHGTIWIQSQNWQEFGLSHTHSELWAQRKDLRICCSLHLDMPGTMSLSLLTFLVYLPLISHCLRPREVHLISLLPTPVHLTRSGRLGKAPLAGRLQQQGLFMGSQFWRPESEILALVRLVLSEAAGKDLLQVSLLGLQLAVFLQCLFTSSPPCACLCVQMFPFNKDTSHTGLGLTWVTSF